jgi:hypothetical protein
MKKSKSKPTPVQAIKYSADSLAEADKIVAMNPGDVFMVRHRRQESRILLGLALRYFLRLRLRPLCKLLRKFHDNASNKRK